MENVPSISLPQSTRFSLQHENRVPVKFVETKTYLAFGAKSARGNSKAQTLNLGSGKTSATNTMVPGGCPGKTMDAAIFCVAPLVPSCKCQTVTEASVARRSTLYLVGAT